MHFTIFILVSIRNMWIIEALRNNSTVFEELERVRGVSCGFDENDSNHTFSKFYHLYFSGKREITLI